MEKITASVKKNKRKEQQQQQQKDMQVTEKTLHSTMYMYYQKHFFIRVLSLTIKHYILFRLLYYILYCLTFLITLMQY